MLCTPVSHAPGVHEWSVELLDALGLARGLLPVPTWNACDDEGAVPRLPLEARPRDARPAAAGSDCRLVCTPMLASGVG